MKGKKGGSMVRYKLGEDRVEPLSRASDTGDRDSGMIPGGASRPNLGRAAPKKKSAPDVAIIINTGSGDEHQSGVMTGAMMGAMLGKGGGPPVPPPSPPMGGPPLPPPGGGMPPMSGPPMPPMGGGGPMLPPPGAGPAPMPARPPMKRGGRTY